MTLNQTILIIDDEPNLSRSLGLILQRAGYIVKTSHTFDDAIGSIDSDHYRLVILDNNMPAANPVLLPKILKVYPYLPVLILSDTSLFDEEKENLPPSAHYLVKPISPERLLDCVNVLLNGS